MWSSDHKLQYVFILYQFDMWMFYKYHGEVTMVKIYIFFL